MGHNVIKEHNSYNATFAARFRRFQCLKLLLEYCLNTNDASRWPVTYELPRQKTYLGLVHVGLILLLCMACLPES